MKLQHGLEMAWVRTSELLAQPTEKRYRAYFEMLEKAKSEEKVRKEDAE